MTRNNRGKMVRCPEDARVRLVLKDSIRKSCGALIKHSFGCTRPQNHNGTHHAHTIDDKNRDICWRSWTTEEAVVEAL